MTRSGQKTDQSACPDPANVAWISRCGIGSEEYLTNEQVNRYHRWGGEALTKRVSLVDGNDSKKKKKGKKINTRWIPFSGSAFPLLNFISQPRFIFFASLHFTLTSSSSHLHLTSLQHPLRFFSYCQSRDSAVNQKNR